jgi:CRISPR-associated endonuclease/helicase Cas3
MNFDALLAKSRKSGCKDITITAHTQQVIHAAEALFGSMNTRTRLGECWLRFFKLESEARQTFHANLLAACALHDWGKANEGFQTEVRGKHGSQAIRHEHLSALLIGLPEITTWLQSNSLLDIPIILSAVMTHHLKARNGTQQDGFATLLDSKLLSLPCDHEDFLQLAEKIAKELGLDNLDCKKLPKVWRFDDRVGSQNIRKHRDRVKIGILRPLQEDCAGPNELPTSRQKFLLAVRAALIAADAAGSGLVREGKSIESWIEAQFPETPRWNNDSIKEEIIEKRKLQINDQLKAKQKPPFEWNGFQLACDDLPSRALLLAPCGSGKTLAAWRWIASQAKTRPVSRVIFLYPTRATAKEGFRDYVSWAPEADAALMHGSADYDLQNMFDNEDDPRHEHSYETERRLFAMGFWAKSAFSATVDQFLAFMLNSYSSLCMLPIMADSVIVIDEVHSFDRNMLSALKKFLQCFDVPVLCMTATLTQDRRDELKHDCGLSVYNDKPDDLAKIADSKRYHLIISKSREEAIERVLGTLAFGRRVLWVVNTVNRCHEVLKLFLDNDFDPLSETSQLKTRGGIPIYCYHSRFTLADRGRRHEDIISNMKPRGSACLGITTQVCEMSLDLDVDLLVTEFCPTTSLIQRMGRCNRDRVARPLNVSGQIIIYPPVECNPYSPEDMIGLNEFLNLVQEKDLSQSDLEKALTDKNVPSPPWPGDTLCPFIESGPYASNSKEEEQFREGDDYNRQCVREEEVATYLESSDDARPGFILPVPKKLAKSRSNDPKSLHQRLPHYLGVAASGHYHTQLGYCDCPLNQWRTK